MEFENNGGYDGENRMMPSGKRGNTESGDSARFKTTAGPIWSGHAESGAKPDLPSLAADFPAVLSLASLDGANGFSIGSVEDAELSGFSVSAAGDVNADGFGDIVIGSFAPNAEGEEHAGESYVVFGRADGFAARLELASLDGSNGFRISGVDAYDYSGRSVSGAGDVNGDGFDDVIIGADSAGHDYNVGESYIVFGHAGGFAASVDLTDLDGANGFRIEGIDEGDFSGESVSAAGDVNGDGLDDIIVGASGAGSGDDASRGESYVVFGKTGGFEPSFSLSALDGGNGFRLEGIEAGDQSGIAVSSAGDFNGDGLHDMIIGARFADPGGNDQAGQSYIVFGRTDGFAPTVNLAALDGSNGFRINGVNSGDWSGEEVSEAGDVNGDGYGDIIIGARIASPNGMGEAGESYVLFGKAEGFSSEFELGSLDGSNGFILQGVEAFDRSGGSVSAAGDINGDGFDDIIIGAAAATPGNASYAGQTYVLFGKAEGFATILSLAALDGANGFRLDGINTDDNSGCSVSSAGDLNGDGFDDLLIGALGGDDLAGESYVIFGRAPNEAVNRLGSAADQTIRGGEFADTLRGLDGDDTLGGGGGADSLDGGGGLDWADYSMAADKVRVDLKAPHRNTHEALGDSHTSIENMRGSAFSDALFGDDGWNRLEGLAKNDLLSGRDGDDTLGGGAGDDTLIGGIGADALYGGDGIDRADYSRAGRVTADLQIAANNTNEALGDSYVGIENLRGGALADNLRGDANPNRIEGGIRNDVLLGRAGDDTLVGGPGFDQLAGQQGVDAFLLTSANPVDYDRIVDLALNETILLDAAAFGLAPGALDPDAFVLGNGARDAEDRLIYLESVGKLFFDPDGAGGASRELIAIIENRPELDASDFMVI